MIGIESLASYVPESGMDTTDFAESLGKNLLFLEERIGTTFIPQLLSDTPVVDLAEHAFHQLLERSELIPENLDLLVVVTQNPDFGGLPHNSSLLHHRLGLGRHVETFDLGLGCSGWVHAVSIVSGYMQARGLLHGVVVTADPYSKILSENTTSTRLLFGDAATATLVSDSPRWVARKTRTFTDSENWQKIMKSNGSLEMNGRAVYEFAARVIPHEIACLMEDVSVSLSDIDAVIIHQGSKAVVDVIRRALSIDAERVPLRLANVGNTVSSSVPMTLEYAWQTERRPLERFVACGFGVGLAGATTFFEAL